MNSRAPKVASPVVETSQSPPDPSVLLAPDEAAQTVLETADSSPHTAEFNDTSATASQTGGASKYSAIEDQTAKPQPASALDKQSLQWMIAEAAYYRAEQRNFEPGHEMDDWIAAEREFMARIASK